MIKLKRSRLKRSKLKRSKLKRNQFGWTFVLVLQILGSIFLTQTDSYAAHEHSEVTGEVHQKKAHADAEEDESDEEDSGGPASHEGTDEANENEANKKIPCGAFEDVIGDVQVLNATRTHLKEADTRSLVYCGSWILVNRGWARFKHRDGPLFHLGPQSFLQLVMSQEELGHEIGKNDSQMILFRGQFFAEVGNGTQEFRVLTANARAKVRRGKVILSFSPTENTTQLISLENSAQLENRFEPDKQIQVKSGEMIELNFKLMRVVPSLPAAISVATLRPKLAELRISESDQFDSIRTALRRQGRRFPASLVGEEEVIAEFKKEARQSSRSPASAAHGAKAEGDGVAPLDDENSEDAVLHRHSVEKMVGDDKIGERILYPDRFYGKSQTVRLNLEDPSKKETPFQARNVKKDPKEEAEKKKLIEELSQIRVE